MLATIAAITMLMTAFDILEQTNPVDKITEYSFYFPADKQSGADQGVEFVVIICKKGSWQLQFTRYWDDGILDRIARIRIRAGDEMFTAEGTDISDGFVAEFTRTATVNTHVSNPIIDKIFSSDGDIFADILTERSAANLSIWKWPAEDLRKALKDTKERCH